MEVTASKSNSMSFSPRGIHIFSHIHECVAYYNLLLMLFFIIVGGAIINVLQGDFFHFGVPFFVSDFKVTSNVSWASFVFFAMFNQLVSVIGEELDLLIGVYGLKKRGYYHEIFTKIVGVVMFWQRLTFKYLVMRSQISIIIPVILVDIIAYWIAKELAISARERLNKSQLEGMLVPEILENVYMNFTILQVIQLPMFLILYIATGLTKDDYFSVGAPMDIVGHSIESDTVVIIIYIVALMDQIVYGFVRSLISKWTITYLQHPDTTYNDMHMSRNVITFVYVVTRILYWVRLMFSVSFLTTRFAFSVIYTIGDLVSSLGMYHHTWLKEKLLEHVDAVSRSHQFKTTTANVIVFGTVFMLAEIVALIEFLAITTHIQSTYFEWAHEIMIFGNVITGESSIIILMIIAGISQIGATMATDIIGADFYNYLYGGAESNFLDVYTPGTKLAILLLTRLDGWFRFIMLLQFVLSNCYFVIMVGTVDIIVGSLILNRYVIHKDHKKNALKMIDDLLEITNDFYEKDN